MVSEGKGLLYEVVMGGAREASVLVVMVRESKGWFPSLVRRREALDAVRAERRARYRWARGTRRLMVLLGAADCRL